jgi:hypothetical protein
MTALREVRHVSVSINRAPGAVYAFAANPENLTKWATGLGSVKHVAGEWIADSPLGHLRIRFAGENELGVLDHDVTLDSGVTTHNPMRVLPNGEGSEVVFSLFRRLDMSDAEFLNDANWVAADLAALKRLLEQ